MLNLSKLLEENIRLKEGLRREREISSGLRLENQSLKKRVSDLEIKLSELESLIKSQSTQINKLTLQLGLNSSNSSIPPSQDGIAKKGRKKTISNRNVDISNSIGGQIGHKGSTLNFAANADVEIDHKPNTCSNCGLKLTAYEFGEVRQVHDIVISKVITNHVLHNGICNCGCITVSKVNVPSGTSYGNNYKSFMSYLNNYGLISYERLSDLSRNVFGINVSGGTLCNWQTKLWSNLNVYDYRVKEELLKSKQAHSDETGLNICGKNKWVHVFSTKNYTHYGLHDKRGYIAFEELGLLTNYPGKLMHDCFKSYFKLENIKSHGLCNAHILRELKAVVEYDELKFASDLRNLLLKLNKEVLSAKESGFDQLNKYELKLYRKRWFEIIALGKEEVLKLDDELRQKSLSALLKRLSDYYREYLAFMYDFEIPFTNNQAESDIRMVKLKQKISGCFRSEDHAHSFLRIRGFISTMQKQGENILDAIRRVFTNPNDFYLVVGA